MPEFPAALPHGLISEVFPDVFQVTGTFGFGWGVTITRNMTVIRQGEELIVANTVRLSPEGEAALDALGKVRHVLRIGAFHGMDDPYYVHRYQAKLWGPPGLRHKEGLASDHDLVPHQSPLEGARVATLAGKKRPEVALILANGVLVPCDSYQNWTTFDGCSVLGKVMMKAMGFGPTLVGGPWVKEMGPEVRKDLERLLDEPFTHLAPAHGTPLRDTAKEGLKGAIQRRFGA